jgi:uroporphyrinogen III methyltransferase/synthase
VYRQLRELGAEVLPYPTIAIREYEDHGAWSKVLELQADSRWLIFTSENGVIFFLSLFQHRVGDLRHLARFRIAAVGVGTARALAEQGLKADFVPEKATVARLAEELCEKYRLTGAEVVRVQGNLSDNTITERLAAAEAKVTHLTVYHTFTPDWPEGFRTRLMEYPPDAIMFSSGSTADGLRRMLSDMDWRKITDPAAIVSIGPSTSDRLRSQGLEVTIEATEHSIPGMIDSVATYFKNQQSGKKT